MGSSQSKLHQAAAAGDVKALKAQLKANDDKPDEKDKLDVNEKNKDTGASTMHLAAGASQNAGDCVVELLTFNADIVTDKAGNTPLHAAAANKNGAPAIAELVAVASSKHIDVNLKNAAGDTAFIVACKSGSADSIRYLLGGGADRKAIDGEFGRDPLGAAIIAGNGAGCVELQAQGFAVTVDIGDPKIGAVADFIKGLPQAEQEKMTLHFTNKQRNTIFSLPDDSRWLQFVGAVDLSDVAGSGIEKVGDKVFFNATKITELDLAPFAGVKSVGNYFCYAAHSLEAIRNTDALRDVESLGVSFLENSAVRRLELSLPRLKAVQWRFLNDAKSLEHLDLGGLTSVVDVHSWALNNLPSLKEIVVPPNLREFKSVKRAMEMVEENKQK